MVSNTAETPSPSHSVFTQSGPQKSNRIMMIGIAVLFGATLVGGTIYLVKTFLNGATSQSGEGALRSYRTNARLDLRAEASQTSLAVATLKEGTNLSGQSVGTRDGIEWLEVTAVDGTKGFVPATLVKEFGPASGNGAVRLGNRRIIISTLVNLRATPSLSGKVIGVADGGSRLTADGVVTAEGEDWLRIPIDSKTIAYVMQRFTTADDDVGGDGIEPTKKAGIGVLGSVVVAANVQATPLPESRIVRALPIGEQVRIIGQTSAGISWYVLRLSDGSQGFAPRDAIRVDPSESRWVYPDGTLAPGPNVPKGSGGIIAAQNLDVRATPNAEGEVVSTVSGGQLLQVTSRANGWLKIRLPGGLDGYVPESSTRTRSVPSSAPPSASNSGRSTRVQRSSGAPSIGQGSDAASDPNDVPVAQEAADQAVGSVPAPNSPVVSGEAETSVPPTPSPAPPE